LQLEERRRGKQVAKMGRAPGMQHSISTQEATVMGTGWVMLPRSRVTAAARAGLKQSPARGISHVPPVRAIPCLVHRSLRGVKRGWSIDQSKALGSSEAEGFPTRGNARSGLRGWRPKQGGVPGAMHPKSCWTPPPPAQHPFGDNAWRGWGHATARCSAMGNADDTSPRLPGARGVPAWHFTATNRSLDRVPGARGDRRGR